MRNGVFLVLGLVVAGFAYVIWVRPYLKSLPSLNEAWRTRDNIVGALQAYLEGRRVILIGIWGESVALAPEILSLLSDVDLKEIFGLPDTWAARVSFLVTVLMMIFRTKVK